MTGTATRAVHAGREDLRRLGVHAPPLDRSSTSPLPGAVAGGEALQLLAEGARSADSAVYSRLHAPTTARWERGVAALEQADDAIAFASGMAAITAVLVAAGAVGGHAVVVRPVYGGTDHLLASGLLPIEVTWARPGDVAAACRADTRLVVMETPANPTVELIDIEAVVRAAGAVPVLVDSTFATPVLQQPLRHGAAWAVHSATKFLGGHGDVLAGVVATDERRAAELRQVRILTGAVLDPQAAWLLHRSLPTLPLRVHRAQQTAATLADRLAGHPLVTQVRWPGLTACDPHRLVGRQMAGPGSVLTFDVAGGLGPAAAVMDSTELITPAVSLGATDSLIQHPAALTHRLVDEAARHDYGVDESTLRLSVGLEDPDDLWRDLDAALDVATTSRRSLTVG